VWLVTPLFPPLLPLIPINTPVVLTEPLPPLSS
jgi:hypothetical protein